MNLQLAMPIDEVPVVAAGDDVTRMLDAAKIADGAALLDALEARRIELNLSNAALEDLAGLSRGFCTKLLGPGRERGRPTLPVVDRLMLALGLSYVLITDPDKLARVQSRWKPRDEAHVRATPLSPTTIRKARPAVLEDLLRRAARRKWRGVPAKDFLKAMAEQSP
jgi:hypothetical protein